ncbi:hypothetical protein BBK36DRAFT_1110026 [Trichoderma citrinoviride]|uniref:Uncharacterized protein n=1 Tax=Trichoderma citrinoviride TaxID=58853 RepID=A0A2T4BJJ3_9HYPO|nr:hypothetical protein BBK36DRAFT_1110026 [Trichoderma citrinoviride]PTB69429.1 hypothetical protein BBK36DRAFT_1110026 [Trichoderma citrinoviride]
MIAGALRRSIENVGALTHILAVRCKETQESNTCEKPASQSGILIAVVITTGLLLLGSLLLVLFWLWLRRRKIDKLEEASDPFELAAYGIEQPIAQRQRRRDYLRNLMGKK